jgi:hypothetical protein
MDGTGVHQVKKSRPGLERQRSHVFSHMWKTDPKDKCMHIYKQDHLYIYDTYVNIYMKHDINTETV